MNEKLYAVLGIAIIAVITAATRFIPFLLFSGKRKTPAFILYLGKVLPFAIMGMLVIYCLRDTSFHSLGGFMPQLIAGALTAGLYVWRKSTLLSIVVGTVSYMLLVQLVF